MKRLDHAGQAAPGLCLLGLMLVGACAGQANLANLEPTPIEAPRPAAVRKAAPVFEPVPGAERHLGTAKLTSKALPALGATLEIRTLRLAPGQDIALPTTSEAIFEVRGGEIETVTDGQNKVARTAGDIWTVAAGSRVTVRVMGQLAVVRGIYLLKASPP